MEISYYTKALGIDFFVILYNQYQFIQIVSDRVAAYKSPVHNKTSDNLLQISGNIFSNQIFCNMIECII